MGYFKQEFRGVFYVRDYEKAITFYRDVLGLEVPYSWDYAPDDRGTKFRVAGGMLEIIRREPEIPQGPGTIMIEAEDVNACYASVSRKPGVRVFQAPVDEPYGVRKFLMKDPDGNLVVIYTNLSELPPEK